MKARVKWVENALFIGESGSGHGIVMDGPPEHGGRNMGIRPMEMLLLGMGGCSAFDVIHILKKGRHTICDCVAEISAQRVDSDPKVFSDIHIHFIVTGQNLKIPSVERAVKLSAEKYCSASIMLGESARITHSVSVEEV